MIPKKSRITRENFEKVMKKGGLLNSSLFSLRFLQNPYKTTHFSVVVSKKVAKTAVSRNRIRRRAYSVLKKEVYSSEKPYPPEQGVRSWGGFIILFAKKGAETAKFVDFQVDISYLLNKAKIV